MMKEIKIPQLGESVNEAIISSWRYKEGDYVQKDDIIAELETDKVSLDITAEDDGVLTTIYFQVNDHVSLNDVICLLDTSKQKPNTTQMHSSKTATDQSSPMEQPSTEQLIQAASPAARKIIQEGNLDINNITGSGKNGIIIREDVADANNNDDQSQQNKTSQNATITELQSDLSSNNIENIKTASETYNKSNENNKDERVPMTKLRKTIARRLKDSQNTAAILTTFNEIDMSAVIDIRTKNQDHFQKKHNAKLGFMSFFVKAATIALKNFPIINASIDEDDIIYHQHANIGVAVSTDTGLVVPVLQNTNDMSLPKIEKAVLELSQMARNNNLTLADISGGTFSITNGGIYGSMLSTPIINPPQSAILGMHNIVERAVVIDKKIEIRPIMYVALSYDHRLIDGSDAVRFLVNIKQLIESPASMLLDS